MKKECVCGTPGCICAGYNCLACEILGRDREAGHVRYAEPATPKSIIKCLDADDCARNWRECDTCQGRKPYDVVDRDGNKVGELGELQKASLEPVELSVGDTAPSTSIRVWTHWENIPFEYKAAYWGVDDRGWLDIVRGDGTEVASFAPGVALLVEEVKVD